MNVFVTYIKFEMMIFFLIVWFKVCIILN